MVCAVSDNIVTRPTLSTPLLLGKLPAHGDFIARGVERAKRERLDRWMSHWLELCREKTGDGFETAYCSAAPWIYESANSHAVLMPSTDAVGRLFPVLAMVDAHVPSQALYDAVAGAIDAAQPGDDLAARLADIETDDEAIGEVATGWFLPEGATPLLPAPDTAEGWAEVEEDFE